MILYALFPIYSSCLINKYSGKGYHIDAKHFNCIILTSCFRVDSFCYIFPSASKPPGKSNRAIFCFHKIKTIYMTEFFFSLFGAKDSMTKVSVTKCKIHKLFDIRP